MVKEQQGNTIQWGSIVFCLENAAFRKGFQDGRRCYFVDVTGEEPQRAVRMTTEELLRHIAVPDAKTGHYHFDGEGIEYLEEYLGAFLGYMSGPLPVTIEM